MKKVSIGKIIPNIKVIQPFANTYLLIQIWNIDKSL